MCKQANCILTNETEEALVLVFIKLTCALGSEIVVQCVTDVDCNSGINVQSS